MKRMMVLAAELGMAALVEVHSEREISTALDVDAEIIGVNNRDLDTLKADIDTTVRLRERIPENRTFVSESAISSRSDVKLLERLGVDAVLVGQLIMKSRNVEAKVKELISD
jgi:indole-3-glycerol phosphate synthase